MEEFPQGALYSFVAAIVSAAIILAIVLWKKTEKGKRWKSVSGWIDEDIAVKVGLITTFFIALWLALRDIGYNLRVLLFDELHDYKVLDVLNVIAFVLAMNLVLTLIKSRKLNQIVNAAMQSVLLGVLLFLPRVATSEAMSAYGIYGSAAILVGFAAILASLGSIYKHFEEKQQDQS